MKAMSAPDQRADILARAVREAPFLAHAADRYPAIARIYVDDGGEAAVAAALAEGAGADPVGAMLRRRAR